MGLASSRSRSRERSASQPFQVLQLDADRSAILVSRCAHGAGPSTLPPQRARRLSEWLDFSNHLYDNHHRHRCSGCRPISRCANGDGCRSVRQRPRIRSKFPTIFRARRGTERYRCHSLVVLSHSKHSYIISRKVSSRQYVRLETRPIFLFLIVVFFPSSIGQACQFVPGSLPSFPVFSPPPTLRSLSIQAMCSLDRFCNFYQPLPILFIVYRLTPIYFFVCK